jgi:hypothetical protein
MERLWIIDGVGVVDILSGVGVWLIEIGGDWIIEGGGV